MLVIDLQFNDMVQNDNIINIYNDQPMIMLRLMSTSD